jgi:hypothetical protein
MTTTTTTEETTTMTTTALTTVDAVGIVGAYLSTIAGNASDDWDTLGLVAEDATGEVVWEVLETAAATVGRPLTDDEGDLVRTVWGPFHSALRAVAAR